MSDGTGRRNHFIPRTREGRTATLLFLLFFALGQPPIVFMVEERLRGSWFLGLPTFYVYLGLIYTALIAVLVWTAAKRV